MERARRWALRVHALLGRSLLAALAPQRAAEDGVMQQPVVRAARVGLRAWPLLGRRLALPGGHAREGVPVRGAGRPRRLLAGARGGPAALREGEEEAREGPVVLQVGHGAPLRVVGRVERHRRREAQAGGRVPGVLLLRREALSPRGGARGGGRAARGGGGAAPRRGSKDAAVRRAARGLPAGVRPASREAAALQEAVRQLLAISVSISVPFSTLSLLSLFTLSLALSLSLYLSI